MTTPTATLAPIPGTDLSPAVDQGDIVAPDNLQSDAGSVITCSGAGDPPHAAYVRTTTRTWQRYTRDNDTWDESAVLTDPGMAERIRRGTNNYRWARRLPAQATDVPAVGTGITTYEQIMALPLGSILRAGSGNRYVKTAEDDWYFLAGFDTAHRYGSGGQFSLNGYNTVERVGSPEPAPAPVGLTVGAAVDTQEQSASLPVGAVVRQGNYEFRRQEGIWDYRRIDHAAEWVHFSRDTGPVFGSGAVVWSLPHSAEVRELMDRAIDAIESTYQLRDERENEYRPGFEIGFWLLGAKPYPSVGDRVSYGSWVALPENTILAWARSSDPSRWQVLRVRGGWDNPPEVIAFGGAEISSTASTQQIVVAMGTPPAQPSYRGPAHFRAELHAMERRLAQRFSWCTSAQSTLNNRGLTSPTADELDAERGRPFVAPGYAVGDVLLYQPDDARLAQLPDGTTFDVGLLTAVKSGDRLVYATTLGRVHTGLNATVRFIPAPQPVVQDEEPF